MATFPVPYVPKVNPPIAGVDARYIQRELAAIQTTFAGVLQMLPQSATAAPQVPQDGMIRLAKSPWRPVAGQTADAWVAYDGSTGAWGYLTP